jgi:hypothetical protein
MPKTYGYLQHRTFPYYKVQWYDVIGLCWRDVQKSHPTTEAATAAFVRGKTCRIMCVQETTRYPLDSA